MKAYIELLYWICVHLLDVACPGGSTTTPCQPAEKHGASTKRPVQMKMNYNLSGSCVQGDIILSYALHFETNLYNLYTQSHSLLIERGHGEHVPILLDALTRSECWFWTFSSTIFCCSVAIYVHPRPSPQTTHTVNYCKHESRNIALEKKSS